MKNRSGLISTFSIVCSQDNVRRHSKVNDDLYFLRKPEQPEEEWTRRVIVHQMRKGSREKALQRAASRNLMSSLRVCGGELQSCEKTQIIYVFNVDEGKEC